MRSAWDGAPRTVRVELRSASVAPVVALLAADMRSAGAPPSKPLGHTHTHLGHTSDAKTKLETNLLPEHPTRGTTHDHA